MDLISLLLVFFFGSCSAKYIPPQESNVNSEKNNPLRFPAAHLIIKRTPADMAMTASRSRQRNKLLRQLWLSQMLDKMRTRAASVENERISKSKNYHNQEQENSSDGDGGPYMVVDMKRALRDYSAEYDNDDLNLELKNDIESTVEQVLGQKESGKQLQEIFRSLFSQAKTFASARSR